MIRQKKFNQKYLNFFTVSFIFIIGVLFILSLVLSSCKDQTTNNGTSDIVFPDSNISFIKYVEPLFQQTCIACHSGNQPAANLNLENDMWHALRDYQPQIVIPHEGNNSPLIWYLDGRLQPRMPFQRQQLTTNQINGVKKWIDEGALNY